MSSSGPTTGTIRATTSLAQTSIPQGQTVPGVKAVRGGSYAVDASHVRPSYRARDAPNFKGPDVGFRCAASASLYPGTMLRRETWGAIKSTSLLWPNKGGDDE